MMDHDEMFDYVLSRYEERMKKKQQQVRIARQAAVGVMCLVMIAGAGVRMHLGRIGSVPVTPPASETIPTTETVSASVTAPAETGITTVSATAPAQTASETHTVTSVPTSPVNAAVSDAKPSTTPAAVQTTGLSGTQPVTESAAHTQSSTPGTGVSVTKTVTTETRLAPISTAVTAEKETVPVTESSEAVPETTAATTARRPGFILASPEPEGVPVETTEIVLPELAGFEVTWDDTDEKLWHIHCLEPVEPSPENVISYRIQSDEYRITTYNEDKVEQRCGIYLIIQKDMQNYCIVEQYDRTAFDFICNSFQAPESGTLNGRPCIWGKEGMHSILYWDDGYYSFKMLAYQCSRETMQHLAESLVQNTSATG